MTIPSAFVQELLARTDLAEVVGRYVSLRKAGANFVGLCPFHAEKTPSFTVSPAKQFYHCFGCGAHGNAIDFLMRLTGVSFPQAVRELAQALGLAVPDEAVLSPQARARAAAERARQATLTEVLAQAAKAYQRQLKASPNAIAYLKGRGLTGQIAKTFGLGYAPPGWRFLSTVYGDYQDERLVEAGLVIAAEGENGAADGKRYDRFRDRIIFPIRNVKGEVIGLGGRVLDGGEPKYLNSPETLIFHKGKELYGLFEARSAIRQMGYVLVTEGYMDVVALAQSGFANTVATLGTACTEHHVRKLFRFSDTVVFAFDGDAAGQRAARRALEAALPLVTDTRSVRFLFLPPEHDPDSFVRTKGAQAFADAVRDAMPLSRFMLDVAAHGCDTNTPEGRARLSAQAQPLWSAMPDGTLKRQLLNELADAIALEPRELLAVWSAGAHRMDARARVAVARDAHPLAAALRSETALQRVPDAARPAPPKALARTQAVAASSRRVQRAARGLLDRADRVARIVLSTPQAWDWLTPDDHTLLAAQPAPHGPLFAWLERQWLEHGPQPWAALREALRGEPFEALAVALHESGLPLERVDTMAPDATPPSSDDIQRELRELLRRMRIEALKQMESELIARADSDPSALDRYRQVIAERYLLQQDGDSI